MLWRLSYTVVQPKHPILHKAVHKRGSDEARSVLWQSCRTWPQGFDAQRFSIRTCCLKLRPNLTLQCDTGSLSEITKWSKNWASTQMSTNSDSAASTTFQGLNIVGRITASITTNTQAQPTGQHNMGALIIRIRNWGVLYYTYNKKHPNSIGNY